EKKTKKSDGALKGVVIVISGIQNPERAQIRDTALKMGAEYRPNWCKEATHLITAVANSPKVKEALSKKKTAKIISAEWISDCYSKNKKLSERKYSMIAPRLKDDLADDDDDGGGSDDEDDEADGYTKEEQQEPDEDYQPDPKKRKLDDSLDEAFELNNLVDENESTDDDIDTTSTTTKPKQSSTAPPNNTQQKKDQKQNVNASVTKLDESNIADINKLNSFYKTQSDISVSFSEFVQSIFQSAIQCAKKGDPHEFFADWKHDTPAPKAIRRIVREFDGEEDQLVGQLEKTCNQYQLYLKESETPQEELKQAKVNGPSNESVALPDYLTGVRALLDDNLPQKDKKLLKKYIVAYNGDVDKKFFKGVTTHIIVGDEKDAENHLDYGVDSVKIVDKDWILTIHKRKKRVPEGAFVID
ncbi:hypothetical protein AKO1_010484, partial [Acrasis kona]